MPFSKIARCLAIVGVFSCLIGQAQERDDLPDRGRRGFESWDSVQRHDREASGQHRQAVWLEPTSSPTSPGPADRGVAPPLAPERREPIPLRPPSHAFQAGPAGQPSAANGPRTLISVLGSLGAVLGLFFLLAWALRRNASGAPGILPNEALEVLGRAPLAGRQQVHLVRLGSKLVLVSVSQAGIEPLSEVTEPDEVQRLVALCRQGQSNSASVMFRQALDRFAARED